MPKKEKKKEKKKKHRDKAVVEVRKHVTTFYEQAPPGLIKENEEKPEDCIPDLPQNQHARDFLAHAPTKGLWMPLGKEVKVMKCWRCKNYGHRTGDRECPLFISGNTQIEQFRVLHEDPMYGYIKETKEKEKEDRIQQLKALLDSSSSDSDSSSSKDSSKHRKKKKKHNKKHKKHLKKSRDSSDESSDGESPGKKKKKRKHSTSAKDYSSEEDRRKRRRSHKEDSRHERRYSRKESSDSKDRVEKEAEGRHHEHSKHKRRD
ncbi:RP9 [Branchiostoma lanceolatum]|uniref:RP9 protein n=2 Tax=Branchiostoma lanceolatum TaxID=7740 RepID=A0A8K0EAT8_BRALA|nr:RP9 [Branchiostoma lanceolatum]